MQLLIDRRRISCFRFVCLDCFVGKRNDSASAKDVMCSVSRDRCQPGRKFLRVAHAPPCLPGLNEGILHHILGFLAVLQNAVRDREKGSTVCANNHFKCFSIAVNGRPVLFTFTGIHFFVIYSLDARVRDSARKIFRKSGILPDSDDRLPACLVWASGTLASRDNPADYLPTHSS